MRYLPLTDADRRAMLARIGVPSVESLFRDVPERVRLARPVDLPPVQGELAVERAVAALAAKNLGTGRAPSFRVRGRSNEPPSGTGKNGLSHPQDAHFRRITGRAWSQGSGGAGGYGPVRPWRRKGALRHRA